MAPAPGSTAPPLGFGSLWLQTLIAVRRNRELLWPLAGVFFFLPQLFCSALVPAGGIHSGSELAHSPQLLLMLGLGVVFSVAGQLVAAFLAVYEGTAGGTFGQVLGRLRALLLPGVALVLLQGLAIGLGSLAFVLPGLYLFTRLSVALPAMAVAGGTPVEALKTSWQLTNGHVLRIFLSLATLLATLFLFYAGVVSIGIILNTPAALRSGAGGFGWGVGRWLFELLSAAAVAFIAVIAITFYARLLVTLQAGHERA